MPFSLPVPLPQPQVSSLTPPAGSGDEGTLTIGWSVTRSIDIALSRTASIAIGWEMPSSIEITLR